ncbi:MAG TPA: hypothetical protein V6D08_02260 [Candidatus Obscuribacterales bacterium]
MTDVRPLDKENDAGESLPTNEGIRSFLESLVQERSEVDERILDRRVPAGRSLYTDPNEQLGLAQLYREEMQLLSLRDPSEKITVIDADGRSRQTTVGQRLQELPKLVIVQFERSLATADALDQVRAIELLTRVDREIQQRVKELDAVRQAGDIFAGGRPAAQRQALTNPLDRFSLAELQLLRLKLTQVIEAPVAARTMFAAHLAEHGDLDRAKELADTSSLLGGGKDYYLSQLRADIDHRLRRRELAGGQDPLEMARLAMRSYRYGGRDTHLQLSQAQSKADAIDPEKLRRSIRQIDAELAAASTSEGRRQELSRDKLCLEELLVAGASVRMTRVEFALANKHFHEATYILREAGTRDREFVAENAGRYLDALMIANSQGRTNSVFQFHNHLVNFQRHLSPSAFDAAAAERELKHAEKAASELPMESIKELRKTEADKLKALEQSLKTEIDPARLEALTKSIAEAHTSLEGLEMLEHSPAYVRMMAGVYELANRRHDAALNIFAEVEKMDADFAQQKKDQLSKLKEVAMQPVTLPKERSWFKSLMTDLLCSAAAIAAGAAVVITTGWSGPAALAAGAATGTVVRSGLKYAIEGEIQWYDPLIGGFDGMTGGAGALVRRAALNGLSNSARTLTAAERALVATGADSAGLATLTGTERVVTAHTLAKQGLKSMAAELPWSTRLASHVPLVSLGNAEYRAALSAYSSLAGRMAWNRLYANLAGSATTAVLFRGRLTAEKALEGRYDNAWQAFSDYAGDVFLDTATAGAVSTFSPFRLGSDLRNFVPVLYPARTMLYDVPLQRENLDRIEAMLADLQEPHSDKKVREWYFKLPGPKVDPVPRR